MLYDVNISVLNMSFHWCVMKVKGNRDEFLGDLSVIWNSLKHKCSGGELLQEVTVNKMYQMLLSSVYHKQYKSQAYPVVCQEIFSN